MQYGLLGNDIPADHGYDLLSAISRIVPWIHSNKDIGIHSISGRFIGQRRLALNENSRLKIRIEANAIKDILPLVDKSLELNGSRIRIGVPKIQPIISAERLYSRLVIIKGFMDPDSFLDAACRQMESLDIECVVSLVSQEEKASVNIGSATGTCSEFLRRTVRIRDKQIVGFALSVYKISPDDSIRLQEKGIGGRQRFGCGLFIPDRRPLV